MKEFSRKRMVRNKIIAGAVTLTAGMVLCSTIVIFAARTEYVGNPSVDIQEKPAPTALQEETQAEENYAAMTTEELEALVKNPDANLDTMIEQGRLTEEQAAEALHTYNRRLAGEGTNDYAAMTTEELEAIVKNPDVNLDTMIEQGRLTEEQAAEALHTYNRRLAGEGTNDYAAMTTEELEALVKNPDANLDTMIEQGRLTEEQAADALHAYNRRLFGEEIK